MPRSVRLRGRVFGLMRAMLAGVRRARTLGLAAEMSFWLFLSLVPLAAFTGLVAARTAMAHDDWLTLSLFSAMPPLARDLLARQVALVATWHSGVAPFAVAMFLWLASSGVHAVFDALEVQSGTSRPWWKTRLLALATCIGLSSGLAVIALLGTGLEWVERTLGVSLPWFALATEHGAAGSLVRRLAAIVVAVAMIAGLYRAGTCWSESPRIRVLPGSALAVGLTALLGRGYAFYIARAGAGDAYQAGLTVVGVTLMTLWLFCFALLLGVQLNRVLYERSESPHERI
jgi:membrane protein